MHRPAWLKLDLQPLTHPVWWLALVLLACNDHLFKGHHVLPGWLTGKLSDVAFLVVAPVLAAVLLPASFPRRRAVALFFVGGAFAAAKLSSAASDALVAVLRQAGVHWELWTDPTDLLALAVLPVPGWLLRQRPDDAQNHRRRRPIRAWLGLVAGALACVATSAPPTHVHQPFLLNAGPAPTTVTVTWLLREVPCPQDSAEPGSGPVVSAGAAAALAQTLTPGDLDDPRTVVLERGQVAALDGAPPAGISPVGTCSTQTPTFLGICVGAVLQADAVAPVLVLGPSHWLESDGGAFFSCQNPPAPVSLCSPTLDPTRDAGPDAVTLKTVHGVLSFVAGAKLAIAPVDLGALAARATPPTSCRALKQQYASLLQPQPCTSNTDCVAIPDLMIPGAPTPCGIDTNLASASAIARLGADWDASCVGSASERCPAPPQPAVCRSGTCVALCPDENIPICPGRCGANVDQAGAPCPGTGFGTPCTRADDRICDCVNGHISCDPAQGAPATCPLACNDWPGGGTYVDGIVTHPGLDVGGALDAGPAPHDGAVDGLAADARIEVRPEAGGAGQ